MPLPLPPTLLRPPPLKPPPAKLVVSCVCVGGTEACSTASSVVSVDPRNCSITMLDSTGVRPIRRNFSFDSLFTADSSQLEICSGLLPDLLQTVFAGSDAALVHFGSSSRGKEGLLYALTQGLFPVAVSWLFRLISEFRHRRSDCRFSVRISALEIAGPDEQLKDLLRVFARDERPEVVIVEDEALGLRVDNLCEMRADSADHAAALLNAVINSRRSPVSRNCHLFVSLNLYQYTLKGGAVNGGRSRLALIDLGQGEKQTKPDRQSLSGASIVNVLLALLQGQKHLPSRKSRLSKMLQESIGSRQCCSICLVTSISITHGLHESLNTLQMASRLQKCRKFRKANKLNGDCSNSLVSRPTKCSDAEAASSSEQSCAETVIFLGPAIVSKPQRSIETWIDGPRAAPLPPAESSSRDLEKDKRKMVVEWIAAQNVSIPLPVYRRDCSTQCDQASIDAEDSWETRVLEDIAEDDEANASSSNSSAERLPSMERLPGPLSIAVDMLADLSIGAPSMEEDRMRILSRECADSRYSVCSWNSRGADVAANFDQDGENDDDLEKAMEASLSSIQSHDILQRMKAENTSQTMRQDEEHWSCSDTLPSDIAIYRRASQASVQSVDRLSFQLEAYADERLRQLEKKKKSKAFGCCQSSMVSSGTSSGVPEEFIPSTSIAQQITEQLSQLVASGANKTKKQTKPVPAMLPLTQMTRGKNAELSEAAMRPRRRDSIDSGTKKETKKEMIKEIVKETVNETKEATTTTTTARKSKRRNSEQSNERQWPPLMSPYSKVTSPRAKGVTVSSSGHGSDGGSSAPSPPGNKSKISLLINRKTTATKQNNRESFSASSGYESATGGRENDSPFGAQRLSTATNGAHSPSCIPRLQNPPSPRRRDPQKSNNEDVKLLLKRQETMLNELREAKQRLGIGEGRWQSGLHAASCMSSTDPALVEALQQETRILEKRLVACRNHVLLVTSLL